MYSFVGLIHHWGHGHWPFQQSLWWPHTGWTSQLQHSALMQHGSKHLQQHCCLPFWYLMLNVNPASDCHPMMPGVIQIGSSQNVDKWVIVSFYNKWFPAQAFLELLQQSPTSRPKTLVWVEWKLCSWMVRDQFAYSKQGGIAHQAAFVQ